MSTDRDTTRIVRSWLRTDENDSADRILGTVLDRLDTTPQRRATRWPARRFPEMNTIAKFGLAAAVVAIAAVLGFSYLVAPDVGGPPPEVPPPTQTPTAPVLSGELLDPGTYRLTVDGVEDATIVFPAGSTITVPSGWSNFGGYGVSRDSMVVMFWPWGPDLATVYSDPCQWDGNEIVPAVGPTVDDLADALANQAQRGDAVPIDVTIGGYSGKMIELTVPADIDFADCDGGEFRSWSGRYHQGPGQVDEIYILDVEGQRMVIDAHYMPGTSEADLAEWQAILESIRLHGP